MPGSPPGMVESRGEGQQHGIMGTRASFVSVPVCVNVCVNAGSLSLPLMPSETLWGSSCPGGSLLLPKATDGITRKDDYKQKYNHLSVPRSPPGYVFIAHYSVFHHQFHEWNTFF